MRLETFDDATSPLQYLMWHILGYATLTLLLRLLAPSPTHLLARAERERRKELFSRDIGILRGQIKTTL